MKATTPTPSSLASPGETRAPDAVPMLIEGRHSGGRELRVTLPNGAVWLYDLPLDPRTTRDAAGNEHSAPEMLSQRTLLVGIHAGDPKHASVFQPTAEGIHPFLGFATRIGVERAPRA